MKELFRSEIQKALNSPQTQVKASQVLMLLNELKATNGEILAVGLMLQESAKKIMQEDVQKGRKKKK